MFHGPREEVLPFFSGLGFRLPERKGVADFLQEVTSAKDQEVCQTPHIIETLNSECQCVILQHKKAHITQNSTHAFAYKSAGAKGNTAAPKINAKESKVGFISAFAGELRLPRY